MTEKVNGTDRGRINFINYELQFCASRFHASHNQLKQAIVSVDTADGEQYVKPRKQHPSS